MADDEGTTANSLSHARRQPPLSLNQRHNRILSDLSAATLPRHITKTSSGGENNDGDGERGCLDQDFSVVAEHDDVPSFSGIADFDSPSPPPPYLDEDAQIQSNLGAEEAVEVRNFSGFNDCDSSFPFPSDSINTSMLNDGVLEEDGHACGLNESHVFGIKNSFQNQEGEVDKMHSTKGLSISGSEDSVHNSQVYEIAEKEDKVEKVRIKGRRRLCKLVNKDDNCAREVNHTITDAEDSEITDFHSPTLVKGPSESNYSGGGGNEIRDILNDLTSKFDILSIEKPRKPERADLTKEFKHQSTIKVDRAKNKEGIPEYESAASAFSISSDSSLGSDMESTVQKVPFIERGKKHNFDDEDKSKKIAVGVKADGIKKNAKSISTRHSTRPIDLNKGNEEYDDDDCVLIDEVVAKKAERGLEKVKNGSSNAYEVDEEDKVYDDYVLEQEQTVSLGKKVTFRLSGRISKILFPHQRDGLKWLWLLHCKGKGGILGDDMGLGKTMQICSFLAGLFYSRLIKRVLVVAPKTLLPHWAKELSVVGLSRETREYFGTNVNARQYELQYVLQDKGVLLTTYDIVRHNAKSLSGNHYYGHDGGSEDDFMWDYLILDEGHLIKNPSTQRAKSLLMIPAAHRIIISGTPLQNNLKELWALFNFCCPEILGDYKWFKDKYEKLINRGNEKNASEREKRVGSTVAKDLRETIQPYFLRRLKSDVFEDDAEGSKLSKKNEIIVWLKLTTCQRRIYEAFLKSEIVLSAFDGSPLAALTILKKICDHPLLLTKRAAEDVLEGMDSMLSPQDHSVAEKLAMHIADDAETFDVDKHDVSCKITFIMSLLDDLIPKGHHVLIFSQTRKMLNLIQESLSSNGYEFMRIDGTTKACDRLKIVNDFQGAHGAPIFLLTSQVGGLGLTLTKADRVIVVDPAWNPSTDNQSVDRAYRIGQTKDVIVYRLMTCGTVEEKIYRMQIFKGGLFRSATEHKEQTRYFSKQDLRELFSLPRQGFDISLTQKQMLEEHDQQHMMEESLKDHVTFLESLGIAGVSQHSLLFSKSAPVADAQEEEVLRESGRPFMNPASQSHSYSQDPNGAQFAFRPKDVSLQQKKSSPSSNEPTEEEIRERMNRLSQIFADKGTILKLPDKGERIRKQISDLELELKKVQVSKRSENKTASLEEVSEDFQRMLNIKM